MKIAIDMDNTITAYPKFFAAFTRAMQKGGCEIHVVTNCQPGSHDNVAHRLAALSVSYDHIEITADKAGYIMNEGITVFFDDTDEYFLSLPETVAVFKPREPGNFDFGSRKWVYGRHTGMSIDSSRRDVW
jgi:hypothetical protein